jgi:hypothetical protein
MKKTIKYTITAMGTVVFMASCANSSHMLVYQHTNFGLNAGVNPQSGNLHARIGHRQDFACVIPKIEEDGTIVASRVRVHGPLQVPDIAEIVATGRAASNMGEKPDALTPFVAPTKN